MNLRIVLTLATILAATSACGDQPTVEEAVRSSLTPYCEKLQSCFPEAFMATHMTVTQCVQTGVDSVSASDLDRPSACNAAELDACVADIPNISCAASMDATNLPSSCAKC